MKLIKAIIVALLQVCVYQVQAQVEIPVNMYTGTPSISIPIGAVTSLDVSVPVEILYDANSARGSSMYGSGWNLSAGGSITRELRSYPDDVGYNTASAEKKGWFFKDGTGSNANEIGQWSPVADFALAWDAGELTDNTKLEGFGYKVDTEPDVFHYNFNGFSGSFVFGNDLEIHTIPYQENISIEKIQDASMQIESFIITTNTGYKYTFGKKLTMTKKTTGGNFPNAGVKYAPTEYQLFNASTPVSFTHEWKLTRVDSPDGAYVTLAYIQGGGSPLTGNGFAFAPYDADPYSGDPPPIETHSAFGVSGTREDALLYSIAGSTGSKIDFEYTYIQTPFGQATQMLQRININDTRRGATTPEQFVKTFYFSYTQIYSYNQAYGVTGSTLYLTALTESSDCEKIPSYKFSYDAQPIYGDIQSARPIKNKIWWPAQFGVYVETNAFGIDGWGFSNGYTTNKTLIPGLVVCQGAKAIYRYSGGGLNYTGPKIYLDGAARGSNDVGMTPGVLKTITSPEGGITTFEFEGNQYFDTGLNATKYVGGLRVKSIEYFDGINVTPVKKTFTYLEGRIVSRPEFAVPTSDGLLRSENDLSPGDRTQGSTVGYKIVIVKRPGAGSVRYEYDVPAVFGDTLDATREWYATRIRTARKNATTSPDISSAAPRGGEYWMYPYVRNPNLDFERGLPLKKIEYNEAGKKVQKTVTEYQTIYKTGVTAPTSKVWGVKYERYLGPTEPVFFYGKYYHITDRQRVPKKETVFTYDSTGIDSLVESVSYTYGSTVHKLLTRVKRTTSEGHVYATNMKYPADYGSNSTGETEVTSINSLRSGKKNGIPIEQIETLKRAGEATTYIVGGSVIKLDPMSLGHPMLRSTWQLKVPFDSVSFFNSAVVTSGGTKKFKIDSRYEQTDSIISYTTLGNVKETWNPKARRLSSAGYSNSLGIPIVQVANAKLENVAFSDFETNTGLEFSSSTYRYGPGHTGSKGYHPSVKLTKTITKANVSNYVLAFWVKNSQACTFDIALKYGVTTVPYSLTISDISASSYQYVQKIIPVGDLPSTFTIELSANGLTAPGSPVAGGYDVNLSPLIDDIYFHPENAAMGASTFTFPFGAASVTSSNGGTGYTEYDKLGRPKFIYDKNKDIVKRYVYSYAGIDPLVADFAIPYPGTVTIDVPTNFNAVATSCVTDATYEWNLDTMFVVGSPTTLHTFSTLGKDSVTLRVTSPTYGTRIITKSFYVVPSSLFSTDICVKGVARFSMGEPDYYVMCQLISSTPPRDGTIFKATNGSGQQATYQWQMREQTGSTWTPWTNVVGANDDEFSVGPPDVTYEVRCRITTESNWVGFTPVYTMVNGN
jgi:hypothetical protein